MQVKISISPKGSRLGWKKYEVGKEISVLGLECLVSTKRSHILKQTFTFQLQVFFKYMWPLSGQQGL